MLNALYLTNILLSLFCLPKQDHTLNEFTHFLISSTKSFPSFCFHIYHHVCMFSLFLFLTIFLLSFFFYLSFSQPQPLSHQDTFLRWRLWVVGKACASRPACAKDLRERPLVAHKQRKAKILLFLSNLFACIASLPIILSFDFVLVVKGIKNKILSFLFLCI